MTVLSIAALLATVPAVADVGTQNLSVTNKFTTAITETANLGNSFFAEKQDQIGLQVKMQGDGAGTGNIIICISRSIDGSVWETTPCFLWRVALNGNTAVVGYTNLNRDILGPAGYIKVLSVANTNDISATNCSITAAVKTIKSSP